MNQISACTHTHTHTYMYEQMYHSLKILWKSGSHSSLATLSCNLPSTNLSLHLSFFLPYSLSVLLSIGVQLYCRSPATEGVGGWGVYRWSALLSSFLSFILPFLSSLSPSFPTKKIKPEECWCVRLGLGGEGGDGTKALLFRQSLPCVLWFSVDGWVARLWVTVPNICSPVPCCECVCMHISRVMLISVNMAAIPPPGYMISSFEGSVSVLSAANAHSCFWCLCSVPCFVCFSKATGPSLA